MPRPTARQLAPVLLIALLLVSLATASRAVDCQSYGGGMRWLGGLSLPNSSDPDITFKGSIAYVAMGKIEVVNVGTPSQMLHIRELSQGYYNPRRVDAAGDLLVAALWTYGIEIYSTVQPTNPQFVLRYALPAGAIDVCLVGTICYVATVEGLHVLDLAVPANPVDVAVVGSGQYRRLAARNGYLYAAGDVPGGAALLVYDIADPANSVETSRWGLDVIDAVPQDERLYLARGVNGFAVMSLANPASPTLVGQMAGASFTMTANGFGSYVFPVYSSFATIECYHTANAPPWDLVDAVSTAFGPETLAFHNGYAFVPSSDTLESFDFGTPDGGATLLGYFEGGNGYIRGVAAKDGYAYVTDDGDFIGQKYVRVLDVSDPAAPTLVHSLPYLTGAPVDVVVADSLLYVADLLGVDVVNVGNPARAFRTGHFDTPGSAERALVQGDRLYVADGAGGLSIASLASDPTHPVAVGQLTLPNDSVDLDVVDGHVLVLSGSGQLSVVDVDPPESAHVIGQLTNLPPGSAVTVQGSVAYVDGQTEIKVINLSDPAAPFVMATKPVAGFVRDLHVLGGALYVASHDFGLQVMDVTDPVHPRLAGSLDMQSLSGRVLAADGVVYLSSDYRLNIAPQDCLSLTAAPAGAPPAPLRLAAQPNPFNPSTRIHFSLDAPAPVTL
ncbi:hypothetical protein KDL67_17200, partial [bacterium]|nr:hypothetical protein [bacterium]